MRLAIPFVVAVLLLAPPLSSSQRRLSATCSETAKMHVYSNAFFSEETGDVGGHELALSERANGTCHALLFVYEGVANDDAIELTGKINGKTLTLAGTWVEHLVEHPSGKETTQSHPIRFEATINTDSLRGNLTIDGNSEAIRLKRTPQVWLCKAKQPR